MNTKICKKCDKIFNKPYSRSLKEWVKTKYCSHSCANSINSLGKKYCLGKVSPKKGKKYPMLSGKNSPLYSCVEKTCIVCSSNFTVKNYRKYKAKFCSHNCANKYRDHGKTSLYEKVRKSFDYKEWRKKVFERDSYTCQICGEIGGYLNADHIKPFAIYPELRINIDNGRTLCENCHRQTETWGVHKYYSAAIVEA
jgi:5-methylcytosine-specific restriction endonuclease McrA